ncbi:MAG: T9SS type A sorting domain-containing protein [Balneolales bacterium]|nr:T9SS type A sorting domain-containing protein [Balneolales bacterium]
MNTKSPHTRVLIPVWALILLPLIVLPLTPSANTLNAQAHLDWLQENIQLSDVEWSTAGSMAFGDITGNRTDDIIYYRNISGISNMGLYAATFENGSFKEFRIGAAQTGISLEEIKAIADFSGNGRNDIVLESKILVNEGVDASSGQFIFSEYAAPLILSYHVDPSTSTVVGATENSLVRFSAIDGRWVGVSSEWQTEATPIVTPSGIILPEYNISALNFYNSNFELTGEDMPGSMQLHSPEFTALHFNSSTKLDWISMTWAGYGFLTKVVTHEGRSLRPSSPVATFPFFTSSPNLNDITFRDISANGFTDIITSIGVHYNVGEGELVQSDDFFVDENPKNVYWTNVFGVNSSVLVARDPETRPVRQSALRFYTLPDCEPGESAIRDLEQTSLFDKVNLQFTTAPDASTNRFFVNIRPVDATSSEKSYLLSLYSKVTHTAEDGSNTHEIMLNVAEDEAYSIEIWYKYPSGCVSDVARVTTAKLESTQQLIQVWPNYPNPFNPSTTIPFQLSRPAYVSMDLFDVLGRRVYSLPSRLYDQLGTYQFDLNLSGLSSGTYFYRINVQSRTSYGSQTGKLQLVK